MAGGGGFVSKRLYFVTLAVMLIGYQMMPGRASSHREAPLISGDPLADNTEEPRALSRPTQSQDSGSSHGRRSGGGRPARHLHGRRAGVGLFQGGSRGRRRRAIALALRTGTRDATIRAHAQTIASAPPEIAAK
jgi:hypothetical protein